MQPVSQLTLTAQREKQYVQLGMGTEHNIASQHKLSQFRHPNQPRELDRLLRLEPAPAGLGVEKSGRATTGR